MRKLIAHLPLAVVGGILYMGIEMAWRGRTHWSMGILGGLCFILIGLLDEYWPDMKLWKQCVAGALIVTVLEYITGMIVNVWLGWNVWDYTNMPFNVSGQICLPFTVAWVALSYVAVKVENRIHKLIDKVRK